MNLHAAPLALFAVFAGLSMNLVLQFGLGMRGIVIYQGPDKKPPLVQLGIMFITIILLWIIFSIFIAALPLGFFTYILVLPLSSFAYYGFEYLCRRFVIKQAADSQSPVNFRDGFTGTALFITLIIAGGFVEALILALGFVLGILLTFMILSEIRRRSLMEEVPLFLRGAPLALISMGLLSMIFSFAALMFFRALGTQ